jgi:hypothetical protein
VLPGVLVLWVERCYWACWKASPLPASVVPLRESEWGPALVLDSVLVWSPEEWLPSWQERVPVRPAMVPAPALEASNPGLLPLDQEVAAVP